MHWIHLGRYTEYIEAAERAAALEPALSEAWINQVAALIALGRYDEAVTAAEQALVIGPASRGSKEEQGNITSLPCENVCNKKPRYQFLVSWELLGPGAAAIITRIGWWSLFVLSESEKEDALSIGFISQTAFI
jgi:tetratricopeptide (TPR) repeat protein